MRIIRNTAIFIIILIAVILLLKNEILQTVITNKLETATGFDVEIEKIHVSPIKHTLELNDFRVLNPEQFQVAEACAVKRAFVDIILSSLFSNTVHLPEVDLQITRANLVIMENGETNLGFIGQPLDHMLNEEDTDTEDKQPVNKSFLVDQLHISINTVTVYQFQQGQIDPKKQTYELNLDQNWKNVSDINPIAVMISTEIMAKLGSRMAVDIEKYQ